MKRTQQIHQQIRSDQHPAGSRSELPHNYITLLLVHVSVLKGSESHILVINEKKITMTTLL